jgi:hypothetical protein
MGLRQHFLQTPKTCGWLYSIRQEGFGLPLHAHSARSYYHNIIALSDGVIVFGYGWHKVLARGEVLTDFDNALPHAITARGAASWFNEYTHGGPPADVLAMREDELHTELGSRVDLPDWLLAALTP